MINFVFFGSSDISVTCLEQLKKTGYLPSLIITKPDSPKGRGLELTPSPVKIWAEKNNIPFLTPSSLKDSDLFSQLSTLNSQLTILVSYGKIIPKNIIDIFPKGILNMHPSLLPLLRGPSPIESTILNDTKDNVGVSIMLLDEEMDHGPIVAQRKINLPTWPPKKSELYEILGNAGGKLLAEILPDYIESKISASPQDHSKATYCKIIEKKDGELQLEDDSYKNYLKYCALEGWPGTYFFANHAGNLIRVKITDAEFKDNLFVIRKVIPEGKKETNYEDFIRGLKS